MSRLKLLLLPLTLLAAPIAAQAQDWRDVNGGRRFERAPREVFWDGNCRVEQRVNRDGELMERRTCPDDREQLEAPRRYSGYREERRDLDYQDRPRYAAVREPRQYEAAPVPAPMYRVEEPAGFLPRPAVAKAEPVAAVPRTVPAKPAVPAAPSLLPPKLVTTAKIAPVPAAPRVVAKAPVPAAPRVAAKAPVPAAPRVVAKIPAAAPQRVIAKAPAAATPRVLARSAPVTPLAVRTVPAPARRDLAKAPAPRVAARPVAVAQPPRVVAKVSPPIAKSQPRLAVKAAAAPVQARMVAKAAPVPKAVRIADKPVPAAKNAPVAPRELARINAPLAVRPVRVAAKAEPVKAEPVKAEPAKTARIAARSAPVVPVAAPQIMSKAEIVGKSAGSYPKTDWLVTLPTVEAKADAPAKAPPAAARQATQPAVAKAATPLIVAKAGTPLVVAKAATTSRPAPLTATVEPDWQRHEYREYVLEKSKDRYSNLK